MSQPPSNKTDQIFSQQQLSVDGFKFDGKVARVFSDMISRSVPGYSQILGLLPTLTKHFRQPGLHYYDLGCSLGAGMLAMAGALTDSEARIVGVDNSAQMLSEAAPHIEAYKLENKTDIELVCADICELHLKPSAMVLMNFTLQFIALDKRDQLISQVADSLTDGGVLVLSEKLKFDDAATNSMLIDIHHQFKADQGYSQLEISQKRDAIENVLIPESMHVHTTRLRNAGFSIVTPWLQNLQFVSLLAIK